MIRALWRALKVAWLAYRHPPFRWPDEIATLDGELWWRYGRVWYNGKGRRFPVMAGGAGEDFGFADLSAPGNLSDFSGSLLTAPDQSFNVANLGAFQTPPIQAPQSAFGADARATIGAPPSGFSKFIDNLGTGISKEFTGSPLESLAKILGIGATGLGVANQVNVQKQLGQQTKNVQQAQSEAQSAAAPAVAFGTATLNNAAGGKLPDAMEAQIQEWVKQKKADAASRLSSMGLGNSNDVNQMDQLIEEQAQSMRGAMLAQQEETGLAGINTGVNAATGVAAVASNQQAQLTNLIQAANQALGRLTGAAA